MKNDWQKHETTRKTSTEKSRKKANLYNDSTWLFQYPHSDHWNLSNLRMNAAQPMLFSSSDGIFSNYVDHARFFYFLYFLSLHFSKKMSFISCQLGHLEEVFLSFCDRNTTALVLWKYVSFTLITRYIYSNSYQRNFMCLDLIRVILLLPRWESPVKTSKVTHQHSKTVLDENYTYALILFL